MRIGVDIDETLAASFLFMVSYIQKNHCPDFVWEDCIHHDFWNIPKLNLTREETIKLWDNGWLDAEAEWSVPPVE